MITIPLEARSFKTIEEFTINVVLKENIVYEMAVVNIFSPGTLPKGIGTIMCDAINPTMQNPKQLLCRFTRQNSSPNSEYYIIDTFNLRRLSLKLTGLAPTSLALTICIRPIKHA